MRESTFNRETADIILARLSQGESLRSICRDLKSPAESTVRLWALDDVEGFAAQYARARELQAYALEDELLDIADNGTNDWMERHDPGNPGWAINGEHLQRSRLRFDARRWAMSKILPKAYGEKIQTQSQQLDAQGNPTDPVAPVINVNVKPSE